MHSRFLWLNIFHFLKPELAWTSIKRWIFSGKYLLQYVDWTRTSLSEVKLLYLLRSTHEQAVKVAGKEFPWMTVFCCFHTRRSVNLKKNQWDEKVNSLMKHASIPSGNDVKCSKYFLAEKSSPYISETLLESRSGSTVYDERKERWNGESTLKKRQSGKPD